MASKSSDNMPVLLKELPLWTRREDTWRHRSQWPWEESSMRMMYLPPPPMGHKDSQFLQKLGEKLEAPLPQHCMPIGATKGTACIPELWNKDLQEKCLSTSHYKTPKYFISLKTSKLAHHSFIHPLVPQLMVWAKSHGFLLYMRLIMTTVTMLHRDLCSVWCMLHLLDVGSVIFPN